MAHILIDHIRIFTYKTIQLRIENRCSTVPELRGVHPRVRSITVMKSFFSGLKLGAPSSPAGGSLAQSSGLKRSPSQAEQQLPQMLGKAEKLLNRRRSSTQHDFPLLNEATRLGQLLILTWSQLPCEQGLGAVCAETAVFLSATAGRGSDQAARK